MNTAYSGMYFGSDRCVTVTTEDGVPLAVTEVGDRDAPITVVFVHGVTADMSTWRLQRQLLYRTWGDRVRMVFYDHRGHGRSGSCTRETSNVKQLGRDLDTVLRTIGSSGVTVLVGHSMGGMATISYASQFPDSIGKTVHGVGLFSTSSGRISRSGIPLLLNSPLVDAFMMVQNALPLLHTSAVRYSRLIHGPIIRAALLGSDASFSMVKELSDILMSTDIGSALNFIEGFRHYDDTSSLASLSGIPSTVVCGDSDRLLPLEHSRYISSKLPRSQLHVLRDVGHMVMMESPQKVTRSIAELVIRADRFHSEGEESAEMVTYA